MAGQMDQTKIVFGMGVFMRFVEWSTGVNVVIFISTLYSYVAIIFQENPVVCTFYSLLQCVRGNCFCYT
jgi:hypothetical protein